MAVNITLNTDQSVKRNCAVSLRGLAKPGALQHIAEQDAAEQAGGDAIVINRQSHAQALRTR